MGGFSGEREVSLRSGSGVLKSLHAQGYEAVGIDVDHNVDVKLREAGIEIAYIALHGAGGEDGMIQGLLEMMKIPYTGSGITSSALSMDKELTKLVLGRHGLPFADTVYIDRSKSAPEWAEIVEREIGVPLMLKPACEGSSLGVSLIKDSKLLVEDIENLLAKYPRGLAENYIKGKELTIGVVGTDMPRALPVLELVPKNEYYDYEAKYTPGMTELICPARIGDELRDKIQAFAVKAHKALDCYGVSRVDFVVDEAGENVYILEVNSIPGMTQTSDLPDEIKAEGGTYDSLVLEILASASLGK